MKDIFCFSLLILESESKFCYAWNNNWICWETYISSFNLAEAPVVVLIRGFAFLTLSSPFPIFRFFCMYKGTSL